jgi:succinate dehydrogenase/fumarate reductase cytochrome b subunit
MKTTSGTPTTSHLLQRERRLVASFLTTFVIVSLSGVATWIADSHGTWQQWTYLLHTLAGFWLLLVFARFVVNHVRLAQGFKRPGQASIGWSSVLIFLVVALSGAVIGVIGQYESQRWLYQLHLGSGVVIVVFILIHLFLFRWLRRLFRPDGSDAALSGFAQSLSRALALRLVVGTIASVMVVVLLTAAYQARESTYVDAAAFPFEKAYGEGIFLPSQTQTSTGSFLDARRIGRSEKCGSCHRQITDEWRSSMHARSMSDPFFQKNLNALADKKGMAATRYCGGCHIPIGLLSGELSTGGSLTQGMHFEEGVSCMGCHGISKALSLEGVGSYLYEPEQHYLFGDSDGVLQTELHDYLIKINPRQHRIDMARDILADPTNCATCHEQYIDSDLNDWGWVKLQSQYQTWVEGPFSTHSDQRYADEKKYRCQDCHFPLVDSQDPSADPQGKHRSHRTPAANTAVPFLLGDTEQLDIVTRFMQDNRLSVTLHQETDAASNAGEVVLKVSVASNRIGHFFPAGTVDINEPWLALTVLDAEGREVFVSGAIDDHNQVDRAARFYFSSLVNREGRRVWKHDLFNAVGESYGNLIRPGKADIQSYVFTIPDWAKSPLTATARLRYRKFNHDYSSWALGDPNLRLPIVDMAEDELKVVF